ncbi:MAG: KilA-N domain-containing protein, partial [Christensenellaceae bacterium]|nr:KilA-N domain-containing protein [Christensenellaceae bacterium]
MSKITKIDVNGLDVKMKGIGNTDYISLTDLARKRENEFPSDVIGNWMRTYHTIQYLGLWEHL